MGEAILVLGGVRSGKTRLAEGLAGAFAPVTYVATALVVPGDAEMAVRIERHRRDRPEGWATREVPRDLGSTLDDLASRPGAVLVDCVTLWLTNLLLGQGGGPEMGEDEILGRVDSAARSARGEATVVWVSNEVGLGGVASNPLARRFADLQGAANQRIAAGCHAVYLSVAGLPVRIK